MAVVDDPGPGMAANRRDHVLGDLRAAGQNNVEFTPVRLDPALESALIGAVKDLDPLGLQDFGVVRTVAEVMRPEFHREAGLQQDIETRHDGPRSGVAIRRRNIVVDDQNHLAVHRPFTRTKDVLAVRVVVPCQDICPYIDEGTPVDHLV